MRRYETNKSGANSADLIRTSGQLGSFDQQTSVILQECKYKLN